MVTEEQVLEALRPVQDPELHMSIVELDMVKSVAIDGSHVEVVVALTVPGCPLRDETTQRVTDALEPVDETVVVLSGGNIDPALHAQIVARAA